MASGLFHSNSKVSPARRFPAMHLAQQRRLALSCCSREIWQLAEPHIRELMSGWPEFQGIEPQEAFYISCLAKDSDQPAGWEVCFETRIGLKWVNFCLQLEGDSVVSNTVYT